MAAKRSKKLLYEGKAKILYEGQEPGTVIQYFKDDTTAFNNEKKASIAGKGALNNRISEYIMTRLSEIGVPNHFLERINMREQLVRQVEIIPVEVIVRNIAAGSLSKRLGIEEGTPLPRTIIEFCYKDDELGDPLVSEEHIYGLGWAEVVEIQEMKSIALRVNDFLYGLFSAVGIRLVDFKLEFGRYYSEDYMEVLLADEITPDSCRLWDVKTNRRLDKDVFRHDLGDLTEAYQEVARRLGIIEE